MSELKCVMCERLIDGPENMEYDEDGDVWCSPCFIGESDIGDVDIL